MLHGKSQMFSLDCKQNWPKEKKIKNRRFTEGRVQSPQYRRVLFPHLSLCQIGADWGGGGAHPRSPVKHNWLLLVRALKGLILQLYNVSLFPSSFTLMTRGEAQGVNPRVHIPLLCYCEVFFCFFFCCRVILLCCISKHHLICSIWNCVFHRPNSREPNPTDGYNDQRCLTHGDVSNHACPPLTAGQINASLSSKCQAAATPRVWKINQSEVISWMVLTERIFFCNPYCCHTSAFHHRLSDGFELLLRKVCWKLQEAPQRPKGLCLNLLLGLFFFLILLHRLV